jgi:predicted N-acyltransferase
LKKKLGMWGWQASLTLVASVGGLDKEGEAMMLSLVGRWRMVVGQGRSRGEWHMNHSWAQALRRRGRR